MCVWVREWVSVSGANAQWSALFNYFKTLVASARTCTSHQQRSGTFFVHVWTGFLSSVCAELSIDLFVIFNHWRVNISNSFSETSNFLMFSHFANGTVKRRFHDHLDCFARWPFHIFNSMLRCIIINCPRAPKINMLLLHKLSNVVVINYDLSDFLVSWESARTKWKLLFKFPRKSFP